VGDDMDLVAQQTVLNSENLRRTFVMAREGSFDPSPLPTNEREDIKALKKKIGGMPIE
jgi:hypothetical protein